MKNKNLLWSAFFSIGCLVFGLVSIFYLRHQILEHFTIFTILGFTCLIIGIIGLIFDFYKAVKNSDK